MNLSPDQIPNFLKRLFSQAVAHAAPENCLPAHLPSPPKGRTLVIAFGKAAASMAKATEHHWPQGAPLSGIALTRYGHTTPCKKIKIIEAAHPVPDNQGFEAAQDIIEELKTLTQNDLVLVLVSGGGSSLLTVPAEGISLAEKQSVNKALLKSGAPIGEMNIVRKHLSAIKGGRLVQLAAPAKIVTLAISDVPHDDPSTIASGPTVPDPSTHQDALALIEKYAIPVSQTIKNHLADASAETPKPDNPIFDTSSFQLIAKPADMIEAIEASCIKQDIKVQNLGADIEGEARLVAAHHATIALGNPQNADLILSGGETTVTVKSDDPTGRGGRNCEYLLALAIALNGAPHICALAADTDGIDGSETNAGAIITPTTLSRAEALGLDPQDHLDRHDSFSFFEKLDDLVTTGPTLTNVNDFRAIWIDQSQAEMTR